MRGNYREEAKQLYGDNRGCPRPWTTANSLDLSPIDIPELDERVIRRKSARDPNLRRHAQSILNAKGKLRLAPHPFLFKHKARLCLTDRWHQLLGKKSHKRATCQQHLTCLIRTLTHDRTSFMESLNARQRKRLRTICTADPSHVIPFYHKFMYWENRKVIRHQEALLEKCRRPGEVVGEDDVFRFAIMVCERCRRPGHASGACPDASSEIVGGEVPFGDGGDCTVEAAMADFARGAGADRGGEMDGVAEAEEAAAEAMAERAAAAETMADPATYKEAEDAAAAVADLAGEKKAEDAAEAMVALAGEKKAEACMAGASVAAEESGGPDVWPHEVAGHVNVDSAGASCPVNVGVQRTHSQMDTTPTGPTLNDE